MSARTIVFVSILVLLSGCARHCGQVAYNKEINRQVETFEFDSPPSEVWKRTLQVLDESGTTFADRSLPADGTRLSNWRGLEGEQERYGVSVLPLGEGRSRLQIQHIQQVRIPIYADAGFDPDAGPRKPIAYRPEIDRRRDLMVEWQVIQRSAPARALEIEGAARERQEVVQDVVANGCS